MLSEKEVYQTICTHLKYIDKDNSLVIAGGGGALMGLNGNGKNTMKIKSKINKIHVDLIT